MRAILIQVPEGKGRDVVAFAKQVEAKNIGMWQTESDGKKMDAVMSFISNRQVESFISEINRIDNVQINIFTQGVLSMYPPQSEAPDQVTDIELKSPIEIFLAGLQSIGSWTGFISYAVIGTVIVWIGLFTNNIYLLVGAMLIAPFAGPAMNTAIATARGDTILLKRALLRYFVSLILTIALACLLSLVMQQEAATTMMVERSQISSTAILLALSAGAAGAMNLVQSERSSLVSGTAAGMLTAASLAPPAGVLGMTIAIGEWQMMKGTLFLLVLQLMGINLTGSVIFKLFGLKPKGPRYHRGKKMVSIISIAVTVLLLIGMSVWQFNSEPELQRSSLSKRAEEQIQQTVDDYKAAELVEATAKFTRANIKGQNTLLCNVYVQAFDGDHERIKKELTTAITKSITKELHDVSPLVNVVVMEKQDIR